MGPYQHAWRVRSYKREASGQHRRLAPQIHPKCHPGKLGAAEKVKAPTIQGRNEIPYGGIGTYVRLGPKSQVRMAQAAMGKRDTSVSELSKELGIRPASLYRYVDPKGNLRDYGRRVLNS